MVRTIIACVVLVSLCQIALCRSTTARKSPSEDSYSNKPIPIEEHIKELGYPCLSHEITTEDGYVLTYHRIPHGKHSRSKKRPPIIVQHGLCAASPVWATTNQSLGLVLADAGYDVWLGNVRGTEYARKHVRYDPVKDKEVFWSFSWHEMGYYDLPAAIDYILNVTKHNKLSYIGHSMGTTIYFVMGATRPEYMNKINTGIMLAPVAYLKNMVTPVLNIMHDTQDLLNVARLMLSMYELLPYNEFWYWLNHHLCGHEVSEFICRDVLFLIVGFDQKELSRTHLAEYLDYLPGGTSFRTLLHYGQIINADFKQFDYGFVKNLKKYHSLTPPSYDLSNVAAPTYFYLAPNDWIATPDAVVESAKAMPNLKGLIMVSDPLFNHGDFMWGVDAKALVYDDVLKNLKKHKS